jgi:hypothetical protein
MTAQPLGSKLEAQLVSSFKILAKSRDPLNCEEIENTAER